MVKIYCQDSFELFKTIPNESIDMFLTDPPYGMNYNSGRIKIKHDKIKNDDKLEWLEPFAKEMFRMAKNDTAHYVFCSWHKIDVFKQVFEKYFKVKNILVWVKNNHTAGDIYGNFAPKHELVLFLHKGRSLIRGKRDTNVMFYDKMRSTNHPTEKPVDMLEFMIEKFSDKGDVIFDPFMGSGSTGVAALKTGRKFIGSEIESKYFDVAKNRLTEIENFNNMFE